MYEDSLTISLLPELDAATHPDVWLFPGMESLKNENGVYTENVKKYKAGTWSKWSVELTIAADGIKVYYEYGLTNGLIDNYYMHYTPLDEYSRWCNRNNTVENLREFIANSFANSVLPNDRNLSERSRRELDKLMRKLVKEIA